jgi:hypothetical protein
MVVFKGQAYLLHFLARHVVAAWRPPILHDVGTYSTEDNNWHGDNRERSTKVEERNRVHMTESIYTRRPREELSAMTQRTRGDLWGSP